MLSRRVRPGEEGRLHDLPASLPCNARPRLTPEPFFFLKPTSSYIGPGETVEIPKGVNCHHEGGCGLTLLASQRRMS